MSRIDPPESGDERETLIGFVDYQRETLLLKCAGLTGAQLAQRSVPTTELTLLGLLRHLAEVERGWFQRDLAGRKVARLYGERGHDFRVPPSDEAGYQALADDALRQYRIQVAKSDEILAAVIDLGHTFPHHDDEVSVRWLLAHMVEEYARHNGHADLLREAIDGSTGE